MATRSNLIYIYETLIKADLNGTLQALREAGVDYQRIIGNTGDEHIPTILDKALLDLSRVQGAPSYILLLCLLGRRKQPLTENELAQVTEHLTSFFVRRNLTGYPQTYGLPRLFMSLATETLALPRDHVVAHVRDTLRRESSPDEEFAARLTGPVYAESTDVARFILTSLAESAMTKETELDLWRMESKHYVWTIEHILQQGEPLPNSWADTLGGAEEAKDLQHEVVHTLGNLTISGYNSHLGNRSFPEKRDRTDQEGRFIGYRNGLSLNADVVLAQSWGRQQIVERTHRLVNETLARFPL